MAKAEPILLSETDLENAAPRIVNGVPKTRVLSLGNGLMLQIVPGKVIDGQYSVSKSWLWRYSSAGVEHRLGLGSFDKIPLSRARVKAETLQDQLDRGIDPKAHKKEQQAQRRRAHQSKAAVKTFRQCAEAYITAHKDGWTKLYADQWQDTLARFAYPVIGDLPVADIDRALVKRVLVPIWTSKPVTAKAVMQHIAKVLGWAVAEGLRPDTYNPAAWRDGLEHSLPKPGKVHSVEHHSALHYTKVPAFMAELAKESGAAARALAFLILTGLRSGPVRSAQWREIDWRAAGGPVWRIRKEKMKMRKDFDCPLCDPAVAILNAIKGDAEPDPAAHIFQGRWGGELGESTLRRVLERVCETMKIEVPTPHGFRSSLRDFAGDMTSHPREVAEAALAHSVSGVEGAYRRGDALAKRRQLMQEWADYLSGSNVLPFRRTA